MNTTGWTRLSVVVATVVALLAGGSPAQAADTNVALNAPATATVNGLPALPCTLGSGPEKAVDGRASNIYTDKWCVRSGQPVLTIQLPQSDFGYMINKIIVKHAGFAGENPAYNTREFYVNVRQYAECRGITTPDGSVLHAPLELLPPATFGYVPNNTANQTVISGEWYTPRDNVGQVQLVVRAPTQGIGGATRIYEVEVWGTPSTRNLWENCYNPLA